MKILYQFIVIALFVLFVFVAGCSNEISVEKLTENSIILLNNGQLREAREVAERAITKAGKENGQDDPAILGPLATLALITQTQENYSEAEALYRRAITIAGKNYGADSVQVAKIMNNLSALLYSQKQFDQALSLYEESLLIVQKHFPENDPKINTQKKNIAAIQSLQSGETQFGSETLKNNQNETGMIEDLVPEQIKKAALDKMASMNILLFDLCPMQPVRILGKGIVLPYHCIKKKAESDPKGLKVVLLFAAIESPDKKGSFIFKNSRLVSFESYMAELAKKDAQSLEKSLIEAFPDLYSAVGWNSHENLWQNGWYA